MNQKGLLYKSMFCKLNLMMFFLRYSVANCFEETPGFIKCATDDPSHTRRLSKLINIALVLAVYLTN